MARTTMSNQIDDHTFQIDALIKRVKELEGQQDLAPTSTRLHVECTNDCHRASRQARSNAQSIEYQGKLIRELQQQNANLADALHKEKDQNRTQTYDTVTRLRALEEECSVIGDVPTVRGQSPAGARKYRKYQVHKQIEEMIKGMARLQELIGPED